MPLNTQITPLPPELLIEVYDDDGGSPKSHVVDVHVSWDPEFMKYKSAKPMTKYHHKSASGTARWHKKDCPAKGLEFTLEMERKKPGETWVIVGVHEPSTGQMKTKKYKVKASFP